MKVGILTYHCDINYGAMLQAYALWRTLTKEGHDVEVIDYRPPEATEFYRLRTRPFKSYRRLQWNDECLDNLIKELKLKRFIASRVKLSPVQCKTRDELKQHFSKRYDAVICGSDEVWNINSYRGFNASYFLDFVDSATKKISYAPSFGWMQSFHETKSEIATLIRDLDYVSVRDSNSKNLVLECGVQAMKVADPALLVEPEHYKEIMISPKMKGDYILVYGGNKWTELQRKFICSLSESRNLPMISLGANNKFADKNIDTGIEEWLGYFAQAAYIFTSSFHGTVLSILFKKNFVSASTSNKSIKISDLLNCLGLDELFFSPDAKDIDVTNLYEKSLMIDYKLVDKNLQQYIGSSMGFLRNALDSGTEF